jgi:transposase
MRTPEHGKEAERRRVQAVALAKDGLSSAAIARQLNVDARTVRRWKAAFRSGGPGALQTKRAAGRACRLTRRQRRNLADRLIRGAVTQGFLSDLWTCPRVAQLIQRQYGVTYHVDHIPRLMKSLGFSVQKPERQARERNEPAIRNWIALAWPRLKKRLPAVVVRSYLSMKPEYF